jgi:bifunctional non-homologous end joining protein LigD
MEYGGFEGTIPKGQYGGGTVMVWDQGTWEPVGDVDESLRKGNLKFILHGAKLKGKWVLVRMHGRAAEEKKPNWLLIKEHDSYERSSTAPAITDEKPSSVVTKRSLEQIAANDDHVWNSSARKANKDEEIPLSAKSVKKAPTKTLKTEDSSILRKAPREPEPEFIAPQLALQAKDAPEGPDWIHELKLDGYRIQVHLQEEGKGKKASRRVKLLTRSGLDWTHRMPGIAEAAARLNVNSAILDGEVVVLDGNGRTDFADLQAAFQDHAKKDLTYFAFDLLYLNGRDTRSLPLLQRKELLEKVIDTFGEGSPIRFSDHLQSNGKLVFENACRLKAEGIISKLASATYQSGRGGSWLKVKCLHEQEFVVGGFTPPSKGGPGIGAILLGYYRDGELQYAGRAGTGFSQKSGAAARKRLEGLLQKDSPFSSGLTADARREARWVRLSLVAQIAFATWTHDNLLRQAVFKGFREDKAAKEVVKEEAIDLDAAVAKSAKRAKLSGGTSTGKKDKASGKNKAPGKVKGAAAELVHLTHPEKVIDTASGLTKGALAEYYLAVAAQMLPHIADRPLSVVRCPEGSGKPCFFQKHIGKGMPAGIDNVPVVDRKSGVEEAYITLSTTAGLVGLIQMGVMEIHPWGSHNKSLEKPDRLIFDLDPDGEISWKALAETARLFRSVLKEIGLESFLKTTGGKGLHVVVPIRAEHPWPVIKSFTHSVVQRIADSDPDLYITTMSKAARKGKIYLDYLRNDRGSTAVAPYSSRARTNVPVAVPLDWRELASTTKPEFRVSDFDRWKSRLSRDPWKNMLELRQSLTKQAISALSAK